MNCKLLHQLFRRCESHSFGNYLEGFSICHRHPCGSADGQSKVVVERCKKFIAGMKDCMERIFQSGVAVTLIE